MKALETIKGLYYILWRQLLQMMLIVLLLVTIPIKNLLTINLSIWVVVFAFKLLSRVPSFKMWLIDSIKLVGLTSIIVLAWFYAGAWGWLGFILMICLMAAWRIKQNYLLFDSYTTWLANTLFKSKKEEFNIVDEVKKNEKL